MISTALSPIVCSKLQLHDDLVLKQQLLSAAPFPGDSKKDRTYKPGHGQSSTDNDDDRDADFLVDEDGHEILKSDNNNDQ